MNQSNTQHLLIDTHAHLCDKRLNAGQIIRDMHRDGLEKIITVAYDIKTSLFSVDAAQKNKDIYATAGVHPSEVKDMKEQDLDTMVRLAADPKTVAIGEIGLDYHYDNTDRDNQKYWLHRQMEIVQQTKLPAAIHLRDAFEDMQKIINANLDKFPASAVLHCFSGSKETAEFYLSRGFYLSFSGVITYQNATKFEEIIAAVPRDRLLVETDCPYLTPHPLRGKLNYPAYVRFAAEKVAEIWDMSLAEVAEITKANSYRLFSKMQP